MQLAFHWVRVQAFCYATERQELLEETMSELLGGDEFTEDVSDGEHGETMLILEARLTKQKEYAALFGRLGQGIRDWIREDMDNRVDEDCMFYMRLDKQKAVQGEYEVAHHGDVISITGKIQSHPARKDVAKANLAAFLDSVEGHSGSS
ncbi:MAG: exosome protein [Candidatus Methanomethylophilaceae archaeon]|nr:exosome protein [Candidatus Methanomethylophilaceae archaeon]